jgi:hypothetical protein
MPPITPQDVINVPMSGPDPSLHSTGGSRSGRHAAHRAQLERYVAPSREMQARELDGLAARVQVGQPRERERVALEFVLQPHGPAHARVLEPAEGRDPRGANLPRPLRGGVTRDDPGDGSEDERSPGGLHGFHPTPLARRCPNDPELGRPGGRARDGPRPLHELQREIGKSSSSSSSSSRPCLN